VSPSSRDPLLDDMRLALLSEFGARAMYGHLSRTRRDPELAALLARFCVEEDEQIAKLRALMTALGARPAATSRRRRLAAWLLHLAGRVGWRRFALRLCLESEETVARWYAHYAVHLARTGRAEEARACETLGLTKHRHALALQAWIER